MRHINSLSFMDYFKPFNYMVIFMVSFRRELFQFQNLKSWSISSFLFIHVSFMIFETGQGYCLLKKNIQRCFTFSFSSNEALEPCTLWVVGHFCWCFCFCFLLDMPYSPFPRLSICACFWVRIYNEIIIPNCTRNDFC